MIGWSQPAVNVDSLRELIRTKLADLGQLEEEAFPMSERVVVRGGKPCGIYFCMHGPRSVKLTAVADLERRHVFFYGSDGQRADKTELPLRRAA